MKLLIFRTNIATKKKVKLLHPVFHHYDPIRRWTVDTEDVDHVLRIEAAEHVEEQEVIHLLNMKGFQCEPLED